jgi:hypothetical protein
VSHRNIKNNLFRHGTVKKTYHVLIWPAAISSKQKLVHQSDKSSNNKWVMIRPLLRPFAAEFYLMADLCLHGPGGKGNQGSEPGLKRYLLLDL